MSPLRGQSTVFFQSKLMEELNSESLWTDGVTSSVFYEETVRLFEGAATSLEGSPVPPTAHLLPLLDDDHLGPPSGNAERVNFADSTLYVWAMPFVDQPSDLSDHIYQATHIELFQNEPETCDPTQTMTTYEVPPPAPTPSDDSVASITQTLSATHLPSASVDPSAMMAYGPYFDHGRDSQVPSTPVNGSTASPPPTSSPPSSPRCGGSKSDGEGDTDYAPPSDDDEEYHPTQATSSQKQKKRKAASKYKSPRRTAFSLTRFASSESEKSVDSSRARDRLHPYKRYISYRNLQRGRKDGARSIDRESDFQCPVLECDHVQKNRRIPDLKRHIETHDRWMEPEKWTCCGLGMEMAHLYDLGIEEGMTEEEQIEAGAYLFRGRLMIGGCLNAFARRDALKRHVDNPNISCVGHMDSYPY